MLCKVFVHDASVNLRCLEYSKSLYFTGNNINRLVFKLLYFHIYIIFPKSEYFLTIIEMINVSNISMFINFNNGTF